MNLRTGVTSIHEETNAIVDEFWKKGSGIASAVTLQGKRLVDFHVAVLEFDIRINAEGYLILGVVHPNCNMVHFRVAKVSIFGPVTFSTDIIWIESQF